MKSENFEAELPSGYKKVYYLNAKSAKTGIIFTLVSLVIFVLVMAVSLIPFQGRPLGELMQFRSMTVYLLTMAVYLISLFGYIVLHEMVHGAAYKALTGQKLTFGISWSCAFCGVPQIYVKRKVALIASAAPLVLFTVLFIPVMIGTYAVAPVYYILSATLFGLHLGGCCGDLYVICLLLFRFRSPETLIRDTGPEQSIYIVEDK